MVPRSAGGLWQVTRAMSVELNGGNRALRYRVPLQLRSPRPRECPEISPVVAVVQLREVLTIFVDVLFGGLLRFQS
jgi:hypothetical protein